MTRACFRKTALAVCLILGLAASSLAQDIYFPNPNGDWQRVDPADTGWSETGLGEALAYAREQRSSGVVVLFGGRILAEGYWEPEVLAQADAGDYPNLGTRSADGLPIEDVASLQKSVVSLLAGLARGRELLDFNRPVADYLGEGWSRADTEAEARITVRHLLSMTSGLTPQGRFEAPAGEMWRYNTPIYTRLVAVMEAASGLTVNEYTAQWLTSRIGMSHSDWGARTWMPAGRGAASMGFRTSARDLARIGLLVLADGTWRGEDVVGNPDYFQEAFNPSQPFNEAYGLLWWLNGGATINEGRNPEMKEGSLIPGAPDDLVAALGGLGRKIYVVPSLRLVVSRIGDAPPVTVGDESAQDAFDMEFWRGLMAAAPADVSTAGGR